MQPIGPIMEQAKKVVAGDPAAVAAHQKEHDDIIARTMGPELEERKAKILSRKQNCLLS